MPGLEALWDLPLWAVAGIGFVAFLVVLRIVSNLLAPRPLKLGGAHVVITGGSSGIGKAVAALCLAKGATVSILARRKEVLDSARELLLDAAPETGDVFTHSVDMSDAKAVERTFAAIIKRSGRIDALVCSAGVTCPEVFEDIDAPTFQRTMDVNVLGCANACRAVVPHMKARGGGRICLVSSAGGLVGVFGYTAYAASKFALRGFAEALQMEVKPYRIRVSLACPQDVNTPMLEEENKNKPVECKLISEGAGVVEPEVVAQGLVDGMVRGTFLIGYDVDGFMLTNLTAGMSPVATLWDAYIQITFASLFRLVSLFYVAMYDGIVAREAIKRKKSE